MMKIAMVIMMWPTIAIITNDHYYCFSSIFNRIIIDIIVIFFHCSISYKIIIVVGKHGN